ncbi:peptidylprolyl isomerase [Candidatus Tenderia electrophaga]|jgi:FKBP-type peptidyl-prolyl cis-trans isomerase SlyD|uniref:Peptidyl-prolyl cis-trans isomerase n=1 Tax=Candidatus Tenderia electrophaga TaxID=1748243 RepID=A0A0S2TCJ2_9GAMM|nr:peptidylprolyl isomerase [Candidatus Tenderia electrophaga]
MQLATNKVATIAYTLKDEQGTLIDQADKNQPFAFILGVGNIIPGLENALEGKTAGDQVSVTIEPAEAYGERDDNLKQTLSKEMFEGVDEVKPGMQFHAQTNQGMSVVTVTEVEGEDVTIDGNHPLAGVTLNFDVDVLEVRDATEEELEHGHVHGPGGHEH